MNLEFSSVTFDNGEILDGKKIGELAEFIINKFSEEKLSYEEARIVLEHTKDVLGEFCVIQSLERK